MIHIVNYGMGNLGSIQNMLKKVGTPSKIITNPEELLDSTKIILPGVGAFHAGIENLKAGGWIDVLNQKVLNDGTPILGICLGMQLMTEFSEEGGAHGLGWIEGKTIKFDGEKLAIRVPHMGWNEVKCNPFSPIFNAMPDNPRFYHVHSYYVSLKKQADEIASTSYGMEFTSAFASNNIFGVQFHPEKSHKFGMQLLKNFANL